MSTIKAANVQNTGSGAPTFKNSSGTEIGQLASAWVHFDPISTLAIKEDFNVSSVTDNGTGDYTVNYSTSVGSTPCVVTSASWNDMKMAGWSGLNPLNIPGTSSAQILVQQPSSYTFYDPKIVTVAVFG